MNKEPFIICIIHLVFINLYSIRDRCMSICIVTSASDISDNKTDPLYQCVSCYIMYIYQLSVFMATC